MGMYEYFHDFFTFLMFLCYFGRFIIKKEWSMLKIEIHTYNI